MRACRVINPYNWSWSGRRWQMIEIWSQNYAKITWSQNKWCKKNQGYYKVTIWNAEFCSALLPLRIVDRRTLLHVPFGTDGYIMDTIRNKEHMCPLKYRFFLIQHNVNTQLYSICFFHYYYNYYNALPVYRIKHYNTWTIHAILI